MLKRMGDLYALLFGWPALARLHKGLFYMSSRALGLYNYSTPSISGESWLIRQQLAGATRPVVFDVGANDGEWLGEVRRVNGSACIHAFEPQRALAEQIRVNHRDVKVNVAAVGAEAGFLDLFDYADHPGSQHASLVQGVIDSLHGGTVRSTRVRVLPLDEYCAEHGVDKIDLLKIDVEGFELQVLRGAHRMLTEGRIDAIQFEFNQMNMVARVFVDDFFRLLGTRYTLHRLLPHGLMPMFDQNHWPNEQFVYQNLFASRSQENYAQLRCATASLPSPTAFL